MNDVTEIHSVHQSNANVAQATRAPRFPIICFPLVLCVAALVVVGLLTVYSATYGNANYSFLKQCFGVALGIVAMVLLWRFDYRLLSNMVTVLLVINVVLILSPHLPIIGVEAKGAQSWIKIGIQLQPGEFAKITYVLLAASVVARYGGVLNDVREYIKCLIILVTPFLCIMTQPDLGTGLVYLFIGAVALVAGGARTKYLLITVGVCVALVAMVLVADEFLKYQTSTGDYEYRLLKNYQRNRLLVFLNPEADTSGSGYNLQQAQIAIGSGGLFGKGFMQGTQAALNFLPEAPTDFIFCVLAEESGFVGVVVLLSLYVMLMVTCFKIAHSASDLFGMLIVMCVMGMWLFQILENIGMTCGLMPITGIPLPFMSYGSSFMLVNFVLVGLVGSVYAHRDSFGRKAYQ